MPDWWLPTEDSRSTAELLPNASQMGANCSTAALPSLILLSKTLAPEQPDNKELTFVVTVCTHVLLRRDSVQGTGSKRCVLTRPSNYPKYRREKPVYCLIKGSKVHWLLFAFQQLLFHKPLFSSSPCTTQLLQSGFFKETGIIFKQ